MVGARLMNCTEVIKQVIVWHCPQHMEAWACEIWRYLSWAWPAKRRWSWCGHWGDLTSKKKAIDHDLSHEFGHGVVTGKWSCMWSWDGSRHCGQQEEVIDHDLSHTFSHGVHVWVVPGVLDDYLKCLWSASLTSLAHGQLILSLN